MTTERPWPAPLTDITGQEIKKYRQLQGLTADELAQRVTKAGLRYTRDQLINLEREKGRRTSVSVGEVLVFAAVLGVPPAFLITPVGGSQTVEYLKGRTADPWNAFRWFHGGDGGGLLDGADSEIFASQDSDVFAMLNAYNNHDAAVVAYALALVEIRDPDEPQKIVERQVDKLAVLIARRDAMRARGWTPPPLRPDIAAHVAQVEKEMGG